MKNLFFLGLLLHVFSVLGQTPDPMAKIQLHQLPNGMRVVLAPNPKLDLIQIKVSVGVGMVHEKRENYGVSHLLEHVLFRNDRLKDDMSYLQLIKEKDGEANGTTSWDDTSYWAVMKKNHTQWLIETFHHMLMGPTLSPLHVETEKKTVLLEIGEPNPVIKAIGLDPMSILNPPYLRQPSYWEKEFAVNMRNAYTATQEQLATLRITHQQVKEHYEKFYDPSNMHLMVSGGFDPTAVLQQVKKLFGKYKSNGKGNQRPKYVARLRNRPYYYHDINSGTPRMTLGYQVNGVSYKEEEVLNSYTEYLAHRMMKRLRNLYGETYTVNDRSNIQQGFGYFAVGFESSREKFNSNYELVRNMLRDELLLGKLNEIDIEEAKRLYLNSFALWSDSVENLGRLSQKMLSSNEREGKWITPARILSKVSNKEYLEILKKYAQEKHKFVMLVQPEILFHYDYMLLLSAACILFFFAFRTVLLRPFRNDHVKWVRKVRYPPLKAIELGVGVVAYFLFIHVFYLMERFIFDTSTFHSMGLTAQYLNMIIISFAVIGTFQAVISFVPRKLYFMDDKFVIKSLSYFSRHIPREKIQRISSVSPLRLPPSMWLRLWRSYFYFDPVFWRKGVLIELVDGKCYFFSTRDSDSVCRELQGLLLKEEVPSSLEKSVAA